MNWRMGCPTDGGRRPLEACRTVKEKQHKRPNEGGDVNRSIGFDQPWHAVASWIKPHKTDISTF